MNNPKETPKSMEVAPSLRRFENRDKESVYNLHIKAMKNAGTLIETPNARLEWDKDLDDIERIYINNGGEFYVATVGDVLAGMGALRKIDATTAEIKRMRVEPSMQGKGTGKLILDKLMEKARELGYKKLVLDVAEKQKGAQHLYESRGFKEYKRGNLGGQETIYYQCEL
jgi:ribosomal protein S18 acetylase RimI-like enzyme